MKTIYLLLSTLLLIGWSERMRAQDCPTGVVNINNQNVADAFIQQYPNCKELPENISISGVNITSLSGLSNIERINGDVFITGCDSLEHLEGLENLEYIGGYLRIQNNKGLQSLKGLDGLKTIGSYFYLSNNDSLVEVNHMNALDSIMSKFQIYDMPAIEQINGFNGLTHVGEDLMMFRNDSLKSIHGFTQLVFINDLRIYENNNLVSIDGFDHSFDIGEWLVIRENPSLEICHVAAVCQHIGLPSSKLAFRDNGTGCSSLNEVEDFCFPTSVIEQAAVQARLYPNPLKDQLFIEAEQMPSQILVYDLFGRLHVNTQQAWQIDLSNCPSGSYIVVLQFESGIIQESVIKL